MLRNLTTPAVPYQNRLYFTINEEEGRDVFPHGIVVAPAGISEAEARRRLDLAYRRAVDAGPDTWNWEDVLVRLVADGFEHIQAGHWVERA